MNKRTKSAPSKVSIYRQVADSLLRDLESGKYEAGQKLPSEAALVRRFNTSRITVGRALRELKQKGLLTGVAGSGNYVKASALRENLLFGLLIPNLGETEIFEPICRGMASSPNAGSHALLWGHIGQDDSPEEQAIQLCGQYVERRVSGVFFAPLEWGERKDKVNAEVCSRLDAAEIPVVLLDRDILPFPHRSQYDLVGIDNLRAGYLAAEHLLALGCNDVAFIALAGAASTVEARIAGYREALIGHGQTLIPSRVQRLDNMSAPAVARAVIDSASMAFVCANDRIAGLFLQAAEELGKKVPGDLRVVGIDDVEYARILPIPLTTIHQPCRAIGEAAVTAMLMRRDRPLMLPREILLDCRLVVRKSSGV